MADIAVVGAGYVGLVTGACFAHLGHRVTCLDIDRHKVESLNRGELPIYEPGLESLVRESLAQGRLAFTLDPETAIPRSEFIFVAVQTPSASNGQADLVALLSAVSTLAPLVRKRAVIIQKSTVPIGTAGFVEELVTRRRNGSSPHVVANPEFLREGSAVSDFLQPDRIVVGAKDRAAAERVAGLYDYADCPIIVTDPNTAEMIKYASNSFLAAKISFMNEIAQLCDAFGADVREVAQGMGHDARIGSEFLGAGLGWGGSCFPKDVKALVHMAKAVSVSPRLLEAVQKVNSNQRRVAVAKLESMLGSLDGAVIGLLGLAFKAGTDDLRSAPSLPLAEALVERGASVRGYDPVAMEAAARIAPEIDCYDSPEELADGADALVLVTEWPEFRELDMAEIKRRMRRPVILDGRNFLDGDYLEDIGFVYLGFGAGSNNGKVTPISAIAALGKTA
ncbi:MAG: UDP-glucose/GDP-mannose dehydrogenase family protein [Dehalococcoidia bacterium]